ncbi:MAG TPA: NUDIX domain-containing protein [Thermoanaerobaculia bacterium]|nr:NUDIX domain-containing protein [Thermoanaerobaculia bacterium]
MTRDQSLLAQLRTYQAADAVEEEHVRAMVNLLTNGPDAFSRGHFAPGHFTAGCFILDDANRLLLHHHRRLDRWLQMGGHVEAGEWPEEAALREGREESGLGDLRIVGGIFDLDVHTIPAGKGEPDHDHFDVRYLARTASPESITIDESESKALAWIPLERAAALMPGAESQRVLRKIDRVLSREEYP